MLLNKVNAIDDLIPIYNTEKNLKVVNARELHAALGVKKKFPDWIKQNLREYLITDNINNKDFDCYTFEEKGQGNKNKKEYILTLDCAKELAMLSKCEKGKQIRKYFIDIEKSFYNIANTLTDSTKDDKEKINSALLIANKTISKQQKELNRVMKNYLYNKNKNIELRKEIKVLKEQLSSQEHLTIDNNEIKIIESQLVDAMNDIEYWREMSFNLEKELINKKNQLEAISSSKKDVKELLDKLANKHMEVIIAKEVKDKRIKAFTFRKKVIMDNKDIKYINKFTKSFIEKIHPLSMQLALKTYYEALSDLLEEDFENIIGEELIEEVNAIINDIKE